ncbi:PREDICTED: phosducin-like protein 2 [Propithecus coquereli]|uniref:phosducin-like protein 2 n=1 Tax=Propithecus coquereli TaxID=379532 RepID=UPI00063F2B4F|nr:PREDICTED: phosducin-like protein 2 [Propithecus coquereli]
MGSAAFLLPRPIPQAAKDQLQKVRGTRWKNSKLLLQVEVEDTFYSGEKRLQEWKYLTKKQKFGELREISGNQYVNEVTNAEKDVWVIIHLYRSSIPMCLLVNQHLSLLARKFPETKFVKAIVNSCIQHYHDNCLPTIFVYKNGQIEGKFIGIIECGGINLKLEELEWKLAEVGAIQTDLEENPKKDIVDMMVSSIRNTSIYDDSNSSDSDNDTK